MPTPLVPEQLASFLSSHAGWAVEGGMLCRTFDAATFPKAVEFVVDVGQFAEAAQHHPDIDLRWKKVTLRLVTHDAGNKITDFDVKVAKHADAAFAKYK